MPSFSEPQNSIACWRKRKRDHEDSATLPRPSSFVPFRVGHPNCDVGFSSPLAHHPEGGDCSFQPRCLPRKRRHLQTPFLSFSTPQQTSLFSPNAYVAPLDPYSPPVSPKTLVPLSYPSNSASALRPCHICHRRPTTRHVLDAYADCDLCGERACFICLRQCDAVDCPGTINVPVTAPNGDLFSQEEDFDGRRKICSSCAVEGITETGTEIVRCLDCVRGHTPWSAGPTASPWTLNEMNHDGMGG
ncbi:uncharacterized protein N7477_001176 [Penicillium maclennaniae]|uniref:uncharacterized protein n=1 Tax=Penicillium maclennaniae TaxID=1343394 RepID=UPI00254246F5|nr:uncharacterized protein N7477_001176 [Penicillium maclennaniae]KAJ5684831.1 hypothetical protein N7477_001176 [Penicillium maclennaniae]